MNGKRRFSCEAIRICRLWISQVFGSGTDEHRQIIDQYAAKGYRYVGYIPTDITGHGVIRQVDLIFEIDRAET